MSFEIADTVPQLTSIMIGMSFENNPHSGFSGPQTVREYNPFEENGNNPGFVEGFNTLCLEETCIDWPDSGAKHGKPSLIREMAATTAEREGVFLAIHLDIARGVVPRKPQRQASVLRHDWSNLQDLASP